MFRASVTSTRLARVAANVGWLIFERLFSVATGFLVSIWFVRYIGPREYGLYSYGISFGAVCGALTGLGLDAIVVRELSRNRYAQEDVLGTALAIRVLAAGVSYGVVLFVVRWLGGTSPALVVTALLVVAPISQSLSVFDLWFQAGIDAKRSVWVRMSVTVLMQCFRCAAILMQQPLVVFAAIMAASGALSMLLVYIVYRRRAPGHGRLRCRQDVARVLMAEAWPLAVVALAVTVYMKIDQVMLTRMAGAAITGVYAAAVTISELWFVIPVAVASSVFPLLVHDMDARGTDGLDQQMQRLYDGMAVGSYAVAFAVGVCASPLVTVLYGAAYEGTAAVLRIHAWSLVFVSLGTARSRYLVVAQRTRYAMWFTGLGAAANVTLNLFAIPRWGAVGAAWSSLASQALATYASGFLFAPVRHQARLQTLALLAPFRWRDVMRRFSLPSTPAPATPTSS